MRLISHEKLCSTLQIALGTKERQEEMANFRKDMVRKDKRTWDAFERGPVAVWVCLCLAAYSLFRVGILWMVTRVKL